MDRKDLGKCLPSSLPVFRNIISREKREDAMKEEKDLVVIACKLKAGVSPAAVRSPGTQPLPTSSPAARPVLTPSPITQPFPTPSPFSFSAATTGWSSRPSVYYFHYFLRSLALLFSSVSAVSLLAPSAKRRSFDKYPEIMYCLFVTILAFAYSAFHLCKGVCDIAHKGCLITDRASDYSNFILDQLVGYLLASSSSVLIPAIQRLEGTTFWKAGVVSVSMSFATFLVTAMCALVSGYKLCKRIIW